MRPDWRESVPMWTACPSRLASRYEVQDVRDPDLAQRLPHGPYPLSARERFPRGLEPRRAAESSALAPPGGPLGRTPTSTTGFVARRSRAISLRGGGDQPWDRTTFSRASAERYDHTSSLVGMEPRAGLEPAPAPYEGAVLPATLRGRGPVGWSRTSMVPLKRREHDRSATQRESWSGREDSNLHTPAPEAGGLPITLRPE